MSTFGRHAIYSIQDFLKHVRAGRPIRQDIVLRMVVKGKVVYVRETVNAPLRKTL